MRGRLESSVFSRVLSTVTSGVVANSPVSAHLAALLSADFNLGSISRGLTGLGFVPDICGLLLGILVSPVQADPVVFRSLEPKGWETRWLDTRCSGTIKEQELRSHFGIVAAPPLLRSHER